MSGVVGAAVGSLVPELGQVVRCRDRIWAVNEVTPSSLPPDPVVGTCYSPFGICQGVLSSHGSSSDASRYSTISSDQPKS